MLHSFIETISNIPFFSTTAFGILSMVIVGGSWCLAGLVMGDAPKRKIEPSLVQLFGAIFSCCVSLIIMFATDSVPHARWQVILMTCGLIGIGGFMNFCMLQIMSYAMQRGPNGVIWSIINSALVFPFIGGIVFFNVQFTFVRGFGIVCLLTALVLFACTKDNTSKQGGWRLPAIICLVITAIQQNLTVMPSYYPEASAVSSIVRSLSSMVGILLAAVIYNLAKMSREHWEKLKSSMKNRMLWKYIIALQFFNLVFSYTLFYPGMNVMANVGLGGMCYPMMVGSCIVSFSLAAVLILKERITLLQACAMIVCISGLVLICTPASKSPEKANPVSKKLEKTVKPSDL